MPPLTGQPLDVANAALRRIGARVSVVRETAERGGPTPRAPRSARTHPDAGARVRRGRRVEVFVAPVRLDRTSGTDCRAD